MPIWQKSLIFSPRTYVESFVTLASKLEMLKINPIALLTPLAPRGDGNKFCLYNKKVLHLAPEKMLKVSKLCLQNLTILKINPIALLTPPSTKGRGNLFLPIWQKSHIFSPEHM